MTLLATKLRRQCAVQRDGNQVRLWVRSKSAHSACRRAHDVGEGAHVETGAADQRAIDVRLRHE
jgi:hypothetical protein